MTSSARLKGIAAILIALTLGGAVAERPVIAAETSKLVAPGRLVVAGCRLSCGTTKTLVRDFEGFAVSSTVITAEHDRDQGAAAPGAMADLLS